MRQGKAPPHPPIGEVRGAADVLMMREPVAQHRATIFETLRAQLACGLLGAVLLPILPFVGYLNDGDIAALGLRYSIIGAAVAVIAATLMVRRVTAFPGVRMFSFVIPSSASAFGLVLAVMFAARLNYNRPYLAIAFVLSIVIALSISVHLRRTVRRRFYLVPHGRVENVRAIRGVDWIVMREPVVPRDPRAMLVADLQHDHDDAWERMLAVAAVDGHPVYHTKVLSESLTGKVEMDHLSENSFGSLLPNLAYVKVKRTIDLIAAILLLPLLALPMAFVALAIMVDSKGPAFFLQERMGYRGKPFRMVKFRTMHPRRPCDEERARSEAMTGEDDPRITRLGRYLRRSRIDELPQILNILRGQMSWIGPRPEAIPLSRWYEGEIPFYYYRHIVRPGISGWAQVQQGHVTDVAAVTEKLSHDFYYIKNFSSWLDVLIALKTMRTMLTGFGAR